LADVRLLLDAELEAASKPDERSKAHQNYAETLKSIEEYTKTTLTDRAVAARKLEEAVLGKAKVVAMHRRKSA